MAPVPSRGFCSRTVPGQPNPRGHGSSDPCSPHTATSSSIFFAGEMACRPVKALNRTNLLERERAAKGDEARNRLQLRLLTGDHLDDMRAGLSFLKALRRVDPRRVAVAGHSFGGQLALLAAESDGTLRAAVSFAPAPISWGRSPKLRERLLQAVGKTSVPILLLYAANDFSTAPGEAMAAELTRRGMPGTLRIYPPVGKSPEEGHEAVHSAFPSGRRTSSSFWIGPSSDGSPRSDSMALGRGRSARRRRNGLGRRPGRLPRRSRPSHRSGPAEGALGPRDRGSPDREAARRVEEVRRTIRR